MPRAKARNKTNDGVTKNASPAPSAPGAAHTAFLILALLYLCAVGVHVAALWQAARFPHLSTDEAQYTMVGENLRLGKGFTIRGRMHSGMPPVYPLFIAVAHSVGGASRHSVLWFNSLAICLVVFPAFLIARRFGLTPLNSHLTALAAAFLPHTFYAAMYMAESLQYPLILTAFYMTAKWLDHPSPRRDVSLGLLLGVGLLNKFAELSFLIALLLTLLILGRRSRLQDQPRRGPHALVIFGIVAALELAWMAWKKLYGAGALGTYGTALEEATHALPPLKLLLAYAGDFFLAAGLIVAVPLVYWFRENWKKQRSLAVLLATTLICQLTIHGFLEARLTGMIRERLFLYSFPLIAITAIAGVECFHRQSSLLARYIAPYAPVLFVALISLYTYALPSPAVEAPWAGLLGSITRSGLTAFDYSRFLQVALMAVLLAATLLVVLGRVLPAAKLAAVVAAFLVLFHATTFLFTARLLAGWSAGAMAALQPVINWLASSGVKPGDRLFIAGGPWEFEGPAAVTPVDEFFQSWIRAEGPYGTLSVQLEALARYDVRMISGLAQIPAQMKSGDPLMVDTRVSDMDFVSEFYPYYLYRQTRRPAGPARALYAIDIPPGVFQSLAGQRRADGVIVGSSDGATGVLAISPAMAFVPGRYRLTPQLKTNGERVALAANLHQTNQVLAHFEVPSPDPLEFELPTGDFVNFSVYGKSAPDFVFEGLSIQFVSGLPPPLVQTLSQPTQQFVEERSNSPEASMPLGVLCSVDNINNAGFAPVDRVRKADGLHLFGWAFDSRPHFAVGPLRVEIVSDSNRAWYALAERNARPDIVAAFHAPEVAQSGFRLHAGLQEVPAGWYRVYLIQTENGQPHECQFYRNVLVE